MSRFFHTLWSIIGGAAVVVPALGGVLPDGKAKGALIVAGGALLWATNAMKVLGKTPTP